MRKFTLAPAALAVAVTLSVSAHAGILFPILPYPGSTSTTATAINNNNVITGYYSDADGARHGFVGTLDGNYTSFDFPNGNTFAYGINDDGYITGLSNTPTIDCQVEGCQYLRAPNGDISGITKDDAPLDGFAQQITKKRKYVGQYWVLDGENDFEFGYIGKGTRYRKDIVLPFNVGRTEPRGLNKNQVITGYYSDLDTHTSPAFLIKNGVARSVSFPDANANSTFIEGVNDHGRLVGGWVNKDGTLGGAFFYNPGQNVFNPIDIPGSNVAQARSINNAGLVTIIADNGSFIYCAFESNCPAGAGAIRIVEKSIPGSKTRWAVCQNGCLKPASLATAAARHTPSKLHELMTRDPSFAREPDLIIRR
jgi:hypothetical protein